MASSVNTVLCLFLVVLATACQVDAGLCGRGRGCHGAANGEQENLLQARPLRGGPLKSLGTSHAQGGVAANEELKTLLLERSLRALHSGANSGTKKNLLQARALRAMHIGANSGAKKNLLQARPLRGCLPGRGRGCGAAANGEQENLLQARPLRGGPLKALRKTHA
ncbi:unnamed protein product [Meganyctiphanes norvegica]|uniref:Orexin-A n=1 Tax=Meganyctiphanes norvegica TaxID=48144 RepID=A0AAV2PVK2_MEGNR